MKTHLNHLKKLPHSSLKMILAIFLIIGLTTWVKSQDAAPSVGAQEQTLVVDSLVAMLNREYVFPEKAKEMGALIQKNLKEWVYKPSTEPDKLGEKPNAGAPTRSTI